MSWLIDKAAEFAEHAHSGQTRKFTGLPYFHHCQSVANIVSCFTSDEDIIATAYLHDVMEDCKVSHYELSTEFGILIALDVQSLTSVPKSFGNRAGRKLEDNQNLAKASREAQMVKLADIIDNVPSMMAFSPDFGKKYLKEKLETIKVLDKADLQMYNCVKDSLLSLEQTWN